MGSVVSTLTGGLLGGSKEPKPTTVIKEVQAPAPAERQTKEDPGKSQGVAEARRRRLALSRRTGRSALRVDLAGATPGETRSGISIG